MNRILKATLIVSFIFILSVNTVSAVVNASVELHGEKTDVVLGEDIILKLSAVNIITKPVMTVQVILIPPSGMSVSSSEFVTSGAGQFTSTFNIITGAGKDIEVRIKANQIGDFEVKGRVIYYFGGDISTAEEGMLSLPITVRAPPVPTEAPPIEIVPKFGTNTWILIGIIALLLLFAAIYISGSALKRQRKIKDANDDIETWKNWKKAVAESRKNVDDEDVHDIDDPQSNPEKGGVQINIKNSIVRNSNIGGGKRNDRNTK
ncbi:MAG: hypothetical protein KKG76_05185 [Euryarchaeota archaeon]|nr:hypothetical protein [Euryarchaeota archaeon]